MRRFRSGNGRPILRLAPICRKRGNARSALSFSAFCRAGRSGRNISGVKLLQENANLFAGGQCRTEMAIHLGGDYKVKAFFFAGSRPSEAICIKVISANNRGLFDNRYSAKALESSVRACTAVSVSSFSHC